jgi:carboxymethylenebutenolidase
VAAYGTALVTDKPQSPHRDIARITGEIYFAFGADDELTPPATIAAVREELERHRVRHELETFVGAGHAFMMPGKASSYRPAAAEEVWRKGFALLGQVEQREQLVPAEA